VLGAPADLSKLSPTPYCVTRVFEAPETTQELRSVAQVIPPEKILFPIFYCYTYLLVFLPPLPLVLSVFSFWTDEINFALMLADFCFESGFYFPE